MHSAFAGAVPQLPDSFSYLNPAPFVRHLEGNLCLVIEPLNTYQAKLCLEERPEGAPAQPVPIPVAYKLVHACSLKPAGRIEDEFYIIGWTADYHLMKGNEATVLTITNQTQQAVH